MSASCTIKGFSTRCCNNTQHTFNGGTIADRIAKAKKNKYSKDTWQDQKVLDVNTGIEWTYGELDKLINKST